MARPLDALFRGDDKRILKRFSGASPMNFVSSLFAMNAFVLDRF